MIKALKIWLPVVGGLLAGLCTIWGIVRLVHWLEGPIGPIRCRDGWASSAIGIQGACSHHGGVTDSESWAQAFSFPIVMIGALLGFLIFIVLYAIFNPERPHIGDPPATTGSPYPEIEMLDETFGRACPRCGNQMIKRTAKRGNKNYKPFWGCSRYPKCRGTLRNEWIKE